MAQLLPTLLPSLPDAHENSAARVYVVYPEVEPEKEPLGATFSLTSFVSGACCALLAGAVVFASESGYRHEQHRQSVAK